MRGWFAGLPIHRKLIAMAVAVSGAALVVAVAALVGFDTARFRTGTADATKALAQIFADNVAAAIVFGDPEAARKTLEGIKLRPYFTRACAYGADGTLFADVHRLEAEPCPSVSGRGSGLARDRQRRAGPPEGPHRRVRLCRAQPGRSRQPRHGDGRRGPVHAAAGHGARLRARAKVAAPDLETDRAAVRRGAGDRPRRALPDAGDRGAARRDRGPGHGVPGHGEASRVVERGAARGGRRAPADAGRARAAARARARGESPEGRVPGGRVARAPDAAERDLRLDAGARHEHAERADARKGRGQHPAQYRGAEARHRGPARCFPDHRRQAADDDNRG